MNSLINIDNVKKDHLKSKDYNFKENTTSPITKKRDKEEDNIFMRISSGVVKNLSNIEPTKPIEIKPVQKKILNISDITRIGCNSSGSKKFNQDSFFIKRDFMDTNSNVYLGVCDGHGQLGHLVSAYLKDNLPISLEKCIKRRYKLNSHNANNNNLNKIIEDVFVDANYKLCNQQPFDTNFSGSTCCTVWFSPEKLLCANVGDSRAVLGRCVDGEWKHHDLSRDHKPCDKEEHKRIISKGGRVEPFKDENGEFVGPPRVWLKDDDIPGLAMSRSIGDQIAASVGVTQEPEIIEWKFTKDDMFLIMATDGIWEFINSDECVDLIKEFYNKNDVNGAVDFLIKEATRRWKKEEDVIDDITVILVFFN